MINTNEIYKHYLMLKSAEKSHSKRLQILSIHHGIDEEVLSQILEKEEKKQKHENNEK